MYGGSESRCGRRLAFLVEGLSGPTVGVGGIGGFRTRAVLALRVVGARRAVRPLRSGGGFLEDGVLRGM